jgi:hypothetical protein
MAGHPAAPSFTGGRMAKPGGFQRQGVTAIRPLDDERTGSPRESDADATPSRTVRILPADFRRRTYGDLGRRNVQRGERIEKSPMLFAKKAAVKPLREASADRSSARLIALSSGRKRRVYGSDIAAADVR